MQVQGPVERVISRQAGKGMAYSIAVNGKLYGCGFKQPPCSQGDVVTFQATVNARGYDEVVQNTLVVTGQGAPQQQQRPAPQRAGGGMGKDQYWEKKEQRDLLVQKAIQFQASRNAAIEVVKIALERDLVAVPSAKNKRLDNTLALIDELTDKFNQDVNDAVQGKRQVAAVAEESNTQEVFDDDIPF